jgi:hypothetical protein
MRKLLLNLVVILTITATGILLSSCSCSGKKINTKLNDRLKDGKAEVTLDIGKQSKTEIGELYIQPSTMRVHIKGPAATLTMNLVIRERSSDLTLVMENTRFISPAGTPAVKNESTIAAHTVIFELAGSNIIRGGDGENSISNQTPGQDGAHAIDMDEKNSVRITGSGSASIIGGNGGNGRSAATGNSRSDQRAGARGGEGGFAIFANTITIETNPSSVKLEGGSGGNGGNGGNSNAGSMASNFNTIRDGGNGGRGGHGRTALAARSQPTINTNTELTSGKGGAGGSGGIKIPDNIPFFGSNGSPGSTGNNPSNTSWTNVASSSWVVTAF